MTIIAPTPSDEWTHELFGVGGDTDADALRVLADVLDDFEAKGRHCHLVTAMWGGPHAIYNDQTGMMELLGESSELTAVVRFCGGQCVWHQGRAEGR